MIRRRPRATSCWSCVAAGRGRPATRTRSRRWSASTRRPSRPTTRRCAVCSPTPTPTTTRPRPSSAATPSGPCATQAGRRADRARDPRALGQQDRPSPHGEATAWLGTLNDLRLTLGSRLDVDRGEPRRPSTASRRTTPPSRLFHVYDWLTFLQDTLVHALSVRGDRPRTTDAAYPEPHADDPRDLVDAMVAHARADHPDEACGVIAGPEGSDRPERFVADGERRPLTHVLRVRLDGPVARSTARWTTATRSRSSSTTRTPRPRPTRAAPT